MVWNIMRKERMKLQWVLVLVLCVPWQLWALEVFVKYGNIFLSTEAGVVQLTASGRDLEACPAPDEKTVAYVRDTPDVLVGAGSGDINATELWVMRVDTGRAELLVRGKEEGGIEKTLAGMRSLSFSPDGQRIYFLSSAWATSDSVQMVSLVTKEVRFLIDGVSLRVIAKGIYRGFLLVDRALIKFDKNGDSLGRDVYLWLVTPEGKPVREIGHADGKAAREFRQQNI